MQIYQNSAINSISNYWKDSIVSSMKYGNSYNYKNNLRSIQNIIKIIRNPNIFGCTVCTLVLNLKFNIQLEQRLFQYIDQIYIQLPGFHYGLSFSSSSITTVIFIFIFFVRSLLSDDFS